MDLKPMRQIAKTKMAAEAANLLVGKVVNMSRIGLKQVPCATVRCDRNDYYEHTKMYFVKSTDFLALDEQGKSKLGDMVLIRRAPQLQNSQHKHIIEKVVFSYGQKIDPITKKRVMEHEFVDDILLKKGEWQQAVLQNNVEN